MDVGEKYKKRDLGAKRNGRWCQQRVTSFGDLGEERNGKKEIVLLRLLLLSVRGDLERRFLGGRLRFSKRNCWFQGGDRESNCRGVDRGGGPHSSVGRSEWVERIESRSNP